MSFKNPGSPPKAPKGWPKVNGLLREGPRAHQTSQSPDIKTGQICQRAEDSRDHLRQPCSDVLLPRMVSRKAVAALLVVHVAAMLASQTEAFVPIFTHSELQKIREKERNKGQKKSLILQKKSEEVGPLDSVEPTEEEENQVIKLTAPVEIGMKMNSRQLEKYWAALEELLSEVLLTPQNDK
uniref:Promotilin n=3 Tax=Canis lupus familiaris TaxID=9615 RepID=A0A8C0RCH9_CANLF|eukprot:XP_022281448.1 motilin isoform X2 [Canis lupus familiaris]